MYILIILYILIIVLLNGYEIIFNNKKWKEIMLKQRELIPLTLLYVLIINPISLILTEIYILSKLVFIKSLLEEILIFYISINIFDIYFWMIHYLQHKYFYKYHKVHHRVKETCMIFSFYNNIN